jgi:murein DD-endopeptidase MepM/ murein hydrolase activator NlpD
LAPARPRNVARRRLYRRHLVLRLTSDRTLPIAIALIVLMAAGVSLAPAANPVGAAQANPTGVRLAIGGGAAGLAAMDGPLLDGTDLEAADATGYVDDGTLYKPVAVDTSIQSSAGMLRHYKVQDGDSLTGIASRFGVSMMTLWWANKITTKDALHTGQDLIIPPVTGLVVTVKAGDTIDSLAAANKIDAQQIIDVNGLEDTNLIVGQVLVLPGAKGAPIPTPTPTPTPTKRATSSGGGGGAGVGPSYSGGSWSWPVIGGGNYISQYFHSYHLGIDIAAQYGSPIVAARAGTVVFAGWKSGGGGYQVFIYHGSGMYTAYLHMSSVGVSTGQAVARGQRIGRVGSSGNATGPHCHFAVSIGWPWRSGSYFVNPLRYY